jgi:hypothetical protein
MKLAVAIALLLVAVSSADEKWWSLRPVSDPVPPLSTGNVVDAFMGAKRLPQADRRSLIRRANYDLTGLPPSREAVDSFVADARPDAEAFAEVVDTLLASPRYGEHWARHWLDVVRYADTAGENSDHPLPHAWRYRNWVIDSFDRDKPYDTFVREQLAGDILGGDALVATGYIAIGRRFGHDINESMHLTYEDVIDNLGKAFLGLSISCARCHDHKHDPIPARDYYALYGVLQSTRFPFPGCEPAQLPRDLVPLATPEVIEARANWEKRRDELNAELAPFDKAQAEKSEALKSKTAKLISKGDVPDGGSVLVSTEPIELEVHKGEVVQLSILPRGNYGADTTILDYSITHGENKWALSDLLDSLTVGNPNGPWCFLDTSGSPKFLAGRNESVEGKSELKSWTTSGTPSVFVNVGKEQVTVWTTLPPRTFFVHPGENGPVAIAWLSPVDGKISIDLNVSDGHPGGDGVGWQLDHFADSEMSAALLELGDLNMRRLEHEARLKEHAKSEPVFPLAYAVAEGEVKVAKLHLRGDPEDLGEDVPREFLSSLGGGVLGNEKSSGRLELANFIASPDNPLTARVMVNRIWAWHFGTGIVSTPNDFGTHGTLPTHPELLDYLARTFVEKGWSVKAMHRLILSSASYQQSAGDGGIPRRRLTAEELRDTLLVASGELDQAPGEGHPFPAENSWNFTQHNPFADEYENKKRSVFLMRKRNRVSRFLALFNGADPNASTAIRDLTTVPTQALFFLNDPFFHSCAEKFTARVLQREPGERLDFACRELFCRPVTDEEVATFNEFSAQMTPSTDEEIWKSYARILLGSNEMLHID